MFPMLENGADSADCIVTSVTKILDHISCVVLAKRQAVLIQLLRLLSVVVFAGCDDSVVDRGVGTLMFCNAASAQIPAAVYASRSCDISRFCVVTGCAFSVLANFFFQLLRFLLHQVQHLTDKKVGHQVINAFFWKLGLGAARRAGDYGRGVIISDSVQTLRAKRVKALQKQRRRQAFEANGAHKLLINLLDYFDG